jgi:hypothetical protein
MFRSANCPFSHANKGGKKMNQNAKADSVQAHSHEPWEERLNRRIQSTIRKTQLEAIKDCIHTIDPVLDSRSWEFRRAVVVMAPGFITGVDADRLVQFAAYSQKFVDNIAARIRASSICSEGKNCPENWFEGEYLHPDAFFLDCMVVDGAVERWQTADGRTMVRANPNFIASRRC